VGEEAECGDCGFLGWVSLAGILATFSADPRSGLASPISPNANYRFQYFFK
jgi:hypothetical protein